jgi:hypothetical protein
MVLDSNNNQPDVFHDFATTSGGWNTEAVTETLSFAGGCSQDNPVPTCVVTADATCSATPNQYDITRVDCQVTSGPSYTTTLKFQSNTAFEATGLKIAWIYSGRQTQHLCSTDFSVFVCEDPTMGIDKTYPQQDIIHDFRTTSGGWQAGIPTTEVISFTGGCSFTDAVPDCFISTSCSATSDSNPNKVKCNVIQQANSPKYVRSEISIKTDMEYTLNNLRVVWRFSNNQVQTFCSEPFTVDVYT